MTQSKDFGLLCGAGPKRRGEQSQKGDENRAHCGNDDDLTNGPNPCRLSPDRIFGKEYVGCKPSVKQNGIARVLNILRGKRVVS